MESVWQIILGLEDMKLISFNTSRDHIKDQISVLYQELNSMSRDEERHNLVVSGDNLFETSPMNDREAKRTKQAFEISLSEILEGSDLEDYLCSTRGVPPTTVTPPSSIKEELQIDGTSTNKAPPNKDHDYGGEVFQSLPSVPSLDNEDDHDMAYLFPQIASSPLNDNSVYDPDASVTSRNNISLTNEGDNFISKLHYSETPPTAPPTTDTSTRSVTGCDNGSFNDSGQSQTAPVPLRTSPSQESSDDEEKLEKFFNSLKLESQVKLEKSKKKISHKSDSEEIEEEDNKENHSSPTAGINSPDFPLSNKELKQFKTPKTHKTSNLCSPLLSNRYDSCSTPFAADKVSSLPTPSSCKSVSHSRKIMVKELFEMFNRTVFNNKFPPDMEITWNKRLRTTAGFCSHNNDPANRSCKIELSNKVCDTYERICDTLIHELCHAATWVIDGVRDTGHGATWKKWTIKAMEIHPNLNPITSRHSYEISYKYMYECTVCDCRIGRHSKSVNLLVARCPHCLSSLKIS